MSFSSNAHTFMGSLQTIDYGNKEH